MAALLDGALEPATAEAVRAHITACDRCRTLFEAMQAADKAAHEALCGVAEHTKPSGQFTARVLTEIARHENRRVPFMWRPEVRRLAFVAASAFVIAIGVWIAIHFTAPKNEPIIARHTPDDNGLEPTHRASVVLTTLDLPSVRDLAKELLGEEFLSPESNGHPAGAKDDGLERLNYRPETNHTWVG